MYEAPLHDVEEIFPPPSPSDAYKIGIVLVSYETHEQGRSQNIFIKPVEAKGS